MLAAAFPDVAIGLLGVSLAFGLTVVSGTYAPARSRADTSTLPWVSVCAWVADSRLPVVAVHRGAIVGGVVGEGVLYLFASGRADFSMAGGFASNGFGAHSRGGYSLMAGLVCEVVMTFMFLIVILGSTHKRGPASSAGPAIGLHSR